mmetsp:Transcript_66800/g.139214  ORF Transcript_66800/g.139214 Transcript_66800/m.139214 type:complete len:80 (+) Transcript_66800:146-385(+)
MGCLCPKEAAAEAISAPQEDVSKGQDEIENAQEEERRRKIKSGIRKEARDKAMARAREKMEQIEAQTAAGEDTDADGRL